MLYASLSTMAKKKKRATGRRAERAPASRKSRVTLRAAKSRVTIRAAKSRVTIRAATTKPGDAAGIYECLRAAFEPYRGDYTVEAFADTVPPVERIHQRLETMSVFVALSGAGEIVGTIAGHVVQPGTGHIRGMAVRPEGQGQGIAERLLARAETELRRKKCTRVTLDTTQPLRRAIRFYEKHGYRASGNVADFFGMPLFEYAKRLSGKEGPIMMMGF